MSHLKETPFDAPIFVFACDCGHDVDPDCVDRGPGHACAEHAPTCSINNRFADIAE